jgi:hypothetical protein
MIPICGAKAKSTGKPCERYPCKNGRCHLHGGKSTGPRTEEGRARQVKAVTKHGLASKAAKEERRQLREFVRQCKTSLEY